MGKTMPEDRQIDPRLGRSVLDKHGREDHSQSGGPLAIAVRMVQRDNLGDRVRELIKSEKLALQAAMEGYETFEEADDFDVGDETFDPQTPYEEVFEGSIKEDMSERFAEQKEKLKKLKSPELRTFLANMDPLELRQAVNEMGMIGAEDETQVPPGGEKGQLS